MMKFIKTVQTTNGNYAVFFQQIPDNFVHIAGVYINKDGHLIRPMSGFEPIETWNKWGKAAKAVVPKFHIPFLTIGRELEQFYQEFLRTEERFDTVENAEKRLKEEGNKIFQIKKTHDEKYNAKHYFMGKTIEEVCIAYCGKKEYEECLRNEDFSDCQVQFYFFNVIS